MFCVFVIDFSEIKLRSFNNKITGTAKECKIINNIYLGEFD